MRERLESRRRLVGRLKSQDRWDEAVTAGAERKGLPA